MKSFLLMVTGCLLALPVGAANPSPAENAKRWILLPVEFDMFELTASGVVEPVPEWSTTVETHFTHALSQWHTLHPEFPIDHINILDPQVIKNDPTIEQHIHLLKRVIFAARHALDNTTSSKLKKAKRKHFDFTIGPGLDSLGSEHNVTHALFIDGHDARSTNNRIAAAVALALLGIQAEQPESSLLACLIELKTGRIVWMNHENIGTAKILTDKGAEQMMLKLLKDFPDRGLTRSVTFAP